MGVLGELKPGQIKTTLIHEHAMVDFIGASQTGTHRYNIDEVIAKALPYLMDVKNAGCNTFVDCTPAYIGRDVNVLKQLSQKSRLNIITTTGYYGASNEKFLPPHAYTETPEQLAARWTKEWKDGIDGTDVRPGIIKTGVDAGSLRPIYVKLLTACALTHLRTGLSISAHTGDGVAALEEIEIMKKNKVHPSAFRWVHAQSEKDQDIHIRAAKLGAWIEFDGINGDDKENIDEHVKFVKHMKDNGFLKQVLVSQDAGWYNVGESNGGNFRGFTGLFTKFLPALKSAGFSDDDVAQLMVRNPEDSLAIRVRKL